MGVKCFSRNVHAFVKVWLTEANKEISILIVMLLLVCINLRHFHKRLLFARSLPTSLSLYCSFRCYIIFFSSLALRTVFSQMLSPPPRETLAQMWFTICHPMFKNRSVPYANISKMCTRPDTNFSKRAYSFVMAHPLYPKFTLYPPGGFPAW